MTHDYKMKRAARSLRLRTARLTRDDAGMKSEYLNYLSNELSRFSHCASKVKIITVVQLKLLTLIGDLIDLCHENKSKAGRLRPNSNSAITEIRPMQLLFGRVSCMGRRGLSQNGGQAAFEANTLGNLPEICASRFQRVSLNQLAAPCFVYQRS